MGRLQHVFGWVFLLALSATSVHAQPFIFYRGIVNAASFAPQGLPNGSIARGSIFSIFGRNLGPAEGSTVSAFPLGTNFQGVSIEVCQNANCVAALPLFVGAAQINAIMPSNAPLGAVSVRVTFNGQAGNFSPATVVTSSLGIFAINSGGFGPGVVQNFTPEALPVNSAVVTARPGQTMIAWGTGLGAGLNADNVAPQSGDLPVNVDIWAGGKQVTVKRYSGRSPCCAGVDQIVFDLPADTPTGCYVPIQIRTGGQVVSNTVTTATDAAGGQCSDPSNLLQPQFVSGGELGIVVFERTRTLIDSSGPAATTELEVGAAYVSSRRETGGEFFYNPLLSLPPAGACAAWSVRGNVFGGGGLPGLAATGGALDAGGPLQVSGASGASFIQHSLLPDIRASLLEFNAPQGQVSLSGPGGQDVGALNVALSAGQAVTWTNRAQLTEIDRHAPLAVAWVAEPGASTVAIIGGNYDVAADGSGVFLCLAPAQAAAFQIPSEILSVLPPSRVGAAIPGGRLFVGAVPAQGVAEFQAAGLDRGLALFLNTSGRTVSFR